MARTKSDYENWNDKKQKINAFSKKPYVKVGEIRWYYIGVNVGNELGKWWDFTRPGLIIKSNFGNGLVFLIPISTRSHHNGKDFTIEIKNYPKKARLILNQAKLVDRKRFKNKHRVKQMSDKFVKKLSNQLRQSFFS